MDANPRERAKKSGWQRVLDFVEQPLFLVVISILGGIVGVILYAPVFLLCDACLLLALHRSKAVADKDRGVQIAAYGILFVVATAALLGVGALLRNSARRFVVDLSTAIAEKVTPAVLVNPPALMVRPDVMTLPITIPPLSVAYLVELHPDKQRWIEELPNRTNEPLRWFGSSPDNNQQQRIYQWILSNHGGKELLDVSLHFPFHFHAQKLMPLKVTVSGKQASVHVPYAGTDPYLRLGVVWQKGQTAKLMYPGAVVSEHTHEVVIPSIQAGHEIDVYFLNRSTYFALFDFPDKALAMISGEPNKVMIKLIRPDVSPLDSAPKMGLPPEHINWEENTEREGGGVKPHPQ